MIKFKTREVDFFGTPQIEVYVICEYEGITEKERTLGYTDFIGTSKDEIIEHLEEIIKQIKEDE